MDLSFVIITKGARQSWLEKAVLSIKHQNIPHHEVIVVGKCENLEGIIYVEDLEKGKPRNKGVEIAKYHNIVFIDDDVELLNGWYPAIKNFGEDWDLLGFRLLDKNGLRWKFDYVHADENFKPHPKPYSEAPNARIYCSTSNLLVKKCVFDTIKFRDTYYGEDMLFGLDCNSAGFKLKFCYDAIGTHYFSELGREKV